MFPHEPPSWACGGTCKFPPPLMLTRQRATHELRDAAAPARAAPAAAVVLAYRRLERRPSKFAVRYTNLDVLAGVVGSTRSWRRHAGLALFLLALAALLVGFARPSMTRLADREEATIVLVIDVSGSMQAKDVDPTGSRRRSGRPRLRGAAEALQGRRRRLLGDGRGGRARDRRPPARDRRDRLPLPAARHRDRRRDRARRRGRPGRRRGPGVARRPRSCCSRTARRRGNPAAAGGARRAKSFKIPVYTIALGTPEGIVEFNRFGGTRIIPVPPDPRRCGRSRRRPAAASTRPRTSTTCARRTTRWGHS